MKKYQLVKSDLEIINIYKDVEVFEKFDKGIAHHNLQHAINVALTTRDLLLSLDYDEEFIDEAMFGAILHDVGSNKGKEGHANRSYEFAKDYIKRKNINLKYENLVLDAIKNHSDGFETDNIMTLALILADKLDIKYTRITEFAYELRGIRELRHVREITTDINNGCLNISFICDTELDKSELEEFYFIKKVFSAIKSFAGKLNLEYKVYLKDEIWNY